MRDAVDRRARVIPCGKADGMIYAPTLVSGLASGRRRQGQRLGPLGPLFGRGLHEIRLITMNQDPGKYPF
ncbi:MAG: hypothetical protein JWO72_3112 [Caulobacteraceae bacterium]|jgi:hypothetical protein|nr:hypothetical protein [Caulobacteraceae bacterium]